MTEHFNPWQTGLIALTAIPISIQRKRQAYKDMRRRNPHVGLVVFWVKLRQRGYTRSISGLYRVLRRISGNPIKLPNPKYVPEPYEQMTYPGKKCHIDVKFVPKSCLVGEASEENFYQYTFIDEYSRFRILKACKEHSTYSSTQFLKYVVTMVEDVVTDAGRIDVLVNNFGISNPGTDLDFVHTDPAVFLDTVNLNLRSVFMASQAAAKHMAAQVEGSIINISSVGGLVSEIFQVAYGTSKAAINYLTKLIAVYEAKNDT